jgi:hypothetical protein
MRPKQKQKTILTVQPSGRLATDVAHMLRVVIIKVCPKQQVFELLMRHLGDGQFGRSCRATLPLPVLADNLSGELFAAAGIPVVVGQTIDPEAAVGAIVKAWFAPVANGTDYEVTSFEPIPEEKTNVAARPDDE